MSSARMVLICLFGTKSDRVISQITWGDSKETNAELREVCLINAYSFSVGTWNVKIDDPKISVFGNQRRMQA